MKRTFEIPNCSISRRTIGTGVILTVTAPVPGPDHLVQGQRHSGGETLATIWTPDTLVSGSGSAALRSVADQTVDICEWFRTNLTIKQLRVSVLNKTRWYWNIFCLGCESVHEDGDCFCHDWRSVCNVNVRCQLSAMRRVETVGGMMHLYHCGKSTVSSPPPHLNHPPWAASNNTLVSGLN